VTGEAGGHRKELTEEQQRISRYLEDAGVWTGRARRAVQRYSTNRIRRNWIYAHTKLKVGEVENLGAYLWTAIDGDYAFEDADAPQQVHVSADAVTPGSWWSREGRDALIEQGIPPETFKTGPPTLEKRYFYTGYSAEGKR